MPTAFALHTDADYRRALALIDELWDAAPGSPEAELLDVMATLVEHYEKRTRALPAADPLRLVAFKLRELGWSQRELGRRLGWGSGRVSEVLSGKRALNLRMVRELSAALDLPLGLLVSGVPQAEDDVVWVPVSRAQAGRAAQLGVGEADLGPLVGRLLDYLLGPPAVTVADSTASLVNLDRSPDRAEARVFTPKPLQEARAA